MLGVGRACGGGPSLLEKGALLHARSALGVGAPFVYLLSVSRMWLFSPHIIRPTHTTPADGYLGSRNDEERSEMRYVVRIAEFSESSKF